MFSLLCVVSVVLLLAVATRVNALNFADIQCGKHGRSGRIVGGQDASPGEFPWIVSLRGFGRHICGGTLINNRVVLSAAHCLCSGSSVMNMEYLHIVAGEHKMSSTQNIQRHNSGISRFLMHPLYKCGSTNRETKHLNDITLLFLTEFMSWSDQVLPACLPSGSPTFSDKEAVVAGWGWNKENAVDGKRSDVLQKVKVDVIGIERCRDWYRSQGKKMKIQSTHICAGLEEGGKDACWADSGGPLMVQEAGDLMVIGIVSTGIGCARPKLPGLYTRISEYIPWIKQSISQPSL